MNGKINGLKGMRRKMLKTVLKQGKKHPEKRCRLAFMAVLKNKYQEYLYHCRSIY